MASRPRRAVLFADKAISKDLRRCYLGQRLDRNSVFPVRLACVYELLNPSHSLGITYAYLCLRSHAVGKTNRDEANKQNAAETSEMRLRCATVETTSKSRSWKDYDVNVFLD